jgi:dienelactone hydrolase
VVLSGVDGLHFIWAMRPLRGHPRYFIAPHGTSTIRLTVSDSGRVLARAALPRRVRAPGVRARALTLRRDRLVGSFFTPARRHGQGIAVLLIGGSEGGTPTGIAAGYANHGYRALALCYFKCPGLPRQLERIPLEYFAGALRWLARQHGVDTRRVIIDGGSRGGEGALLIASTFPRLVHGAIALSPNYQVYPACCELRWLNAVHPPPAWTRHGRPVAPFNAIRVERISGPVLLESGGQDRVWNSSFSTQQIDQRLADHHFRYRHERLDFPAAGHIATGPQWPSSDPTHFGGSPRANAIAGDALNRAWAHYLRALAATKTVGA